MNHLTRPLRIAFFIEGMSASGVDTSTQVLAAALRQRGHQVVLFVPWRDRCNRNNRDLLVPLTSVRMPTRQPVYWSLPISWSVYERFRQERFDLIHVHTSTTVNLLAWQLAALQHLPIVYTYHTMSVEYAHYLGLGETFSSLVEPAIELFDRVVCNKADLIVAPSEKAARYLRHLDVQPPVHVVPNGINLGAFRPQPSRFLHERLGIDAGRPLLLYAGRLNHEKRPLLAYELFKRVHASRPDAALALVGEGALRAELEGSIAADGLSQSVYLAGAVPYASMPDVYNSATLWISTSMSEVHPMVALEAAACGLPALAWNDSALQGVVEAGVTGELVESEDAFVRAALDLLDDPARLQAMGAAAAARAESYRIETTAERMTAIYGSLLSGALPVSAGRPHHAEVPQANRHGRP